MLLDFSLRLRTAQAICTRCENRAKQLPHTPSWVCFHNAYLNSISQLQYGGSPYFSDILGKIEMTWGIVVTLYSNS